MNKGQNGRPAGMPGRAKRGRGRSLRYVRRRGGVNPGYIIFAAVIFLIVSASVFFIVFGKKDGNVSSVETEFPVTGTATEEIVDSQPYTFKEVRSADSVAGDLVLVNYSHEYVFPEKDDLLNIYENKTDDFKVAYSYYMIDKDVLSVLISLTHELSETSGEDDLTVNSAYRSFEDQEEIVESFTVDYGEEYVKNYVAVPGYSEHHTGLAADLTIVRDDGTALPIRQSDAYDEILRLLIENGFILRYPENKKDVTKIEGESWHFRYVGVPHSMIIEKAGICFEEYIDFLKSFTPDGNVLFIDGAGFISSVPFNEPREEKNGYMIFRVAAGQTETTEIPVPDGSADYSVSGDNDGGFIVTVRFGEPSLTRIAGFDDSVSSLVSKYSSSD